MDDFNPEGQATPEFDQDFPEFDASAEEAPEFSADVAVAEVEEFASEPVPEESHVEFTADVVEFDEAPVEFDAPAEIPAEEEVSPTTQAPTFVDAHIPYEPLPVPEEEGKALIEFNMKFRAKVEAKDAKEREDKAARRAAGKAALKEMISQHQQTIDARKKVNREEESKVETEALEALKGESWNRVVSLINVQSQSQTTSETEKPVVAKKVKGIDTSGAVGDTSRMKELLINLKNKPVPTAAAK